MFSSHSSEPGSTLLAAWNIFNHPYQITNLISSLLATLSTYKLPYHNPQPTLSKKWSGIFSRPVSMVQIPWYPAAADVLLPHIRLAWGSTHLWINFSFFLLFSIFPQNNPIASSNHLNFFLFSYIAHITIPSAPSEDCLYFLYCPYSRITNPTLRQITWFLLS